MRSLAQNLQRLLKEDAQMAESVDALVSNTSGATHPGSTPGLGTTIKKQPLVSQALTRGFCFSRCTKNVLYNIK